jgi:hypothetical protein
MINNPFSRMANHQKKKKITPSSVIWALDKATEKKKKNRMEITYSQA